MLSLNVKSATSILILGILALPLYSAEDKESLKSEIYASKMKTTQIFIESKMVRTPADNLTIGLGETKGFQNMDELFKDTSKVEIITAPPKLITFSGQEAKVELSYDIYYVENATLDDSGDITCKIKKSKCGIFLKALPKISEEDSNVITVEYQFELNTLVKRVAPPIPVIACIKEFEALWMPIIDMRKTETAVRVRSGQTIVLGGISRTQGVLTSKGAEDNKEPGDFVELILLTAEKGKTGVVTGPPKKVRAVPQVNNKIPSQIYEYYRDYNFVSSFSSESERGILTHYLYYKELPDRLKFERLEKIYELIKNLNAQVMRIDPEIIFPKVISNQYVVRPELMEIRNAQHHNNEITIEVFVYKIGSESNLRFISQYDEYGGDENKIFSEEQRIQAAMSVSTSIPRTEIHKWELINGKWMKTEANMVLLK